MARKALYPDGTAAVHLSLAKPVLEGIERSAAGQRISTSQLVNGILEDYLLRRGVLREREEAALNV
jgi:hypothetical protein